MDLQKKPGELSAEQLAALQSALSRLTVEKAAALYAALVDMHHDINGHLQLMSLPTEIIRDNLRKNPDLAERMIPTVLNKKDMVGQSVIRFRATFEKCFGLKRDNSNPPD